MKNKYIDKLNKKDKEEMLSRIKDVKDKSEWNAGFHFLNLFFKYIIFLFIAIPLWFIAFEEGHPTVLISSITIFFTMIRVFMYVIIFGFILDFVISFTRQIKIIKIKREYFEIIPKRK